MGPKSKGSGEARSGPAGEEGSPEGCFALGSAFLPETRAFCVIIHQPGPGLGEGG